MNLAQKEQTHILPFYETQLGSAYNMTIEDFILSNEYEKLKGKVQLIFTSPPFPLVRQKKYGNKLGEDYKNWISEIFSSLKDLLTEDGSLVVEIGNAWVKGEPEMSTLPLESLIEIKSKGEYKLCQQFICHNRARLPSPAQWVNIKRIRLKDSYYHIWWLSNTAHPKADNRKVLKPYSSRMLDLLRRGTYNSGMRPSGHSISKSAFNTNNGEAIPSNVIEISNTSWDQNYLKHCRSSGIKPHPAKMHEDVVKFFVDLLTDDNDIVFDPFAGSNTTGAVCQKKGRRWIATEPNVDYLMGSIGRFPPEDITNGNHPNK